MKKWKQYFGTFSFGVLTLTSMGGLVELGPFWQDFSILGNASAIQSSEYFDGNDWEIQTWNYRSRYSTQNNSDDRNITSAGSIAVWQRLTEQGWELLFWSVLEQNEIQLTTNEVDDVDPKTDGRFLTWRSQIDGVWRVMLWDLGLSQQPPVQLSFVGAVDGITIQNGVVAWQEWIEDSWEIMVYQPDRGTQRITHNSTADINPQIQPGYIYYEGEDIQGTDREIFQFDLTYGTTRVLTQNEIDDDAPESYGDQIRWYERRDGISAKMELDAATGRLRIVELIPHAQALTPTQVQELQEIAQEASGDVVEEEVDKVEKVDEVDEESEASDGIQSDSSVPSDSTAPASPQEETTTP